GELHRFGTTAGEPLDLAFGPLTCSHREPRAPVRITFNARETVVERSQAMKVAPARSASGHRSSEYGETTIRRESRLPSRVRNVSHSLGRPRPALSARYPTPRSPRTMTGTRGMGGGYRRDVPSMPSRTPRVGQP